MNKNSIRAMNRSRLDRERKVALATDIPSIPNNLTVSKTFRFVVTTDSTVTPVFLDVSDLVKIGGVVNASATLAEPLWRQYRINSIKAWAPHTLGGNTTLTIESVATNVTKAKYKSDTSINVSVPAYVDFRFPKPRKFADNSTEFSLDGVVRIYAPIETIVDINVTLVQFDSNQSGYSQVSHPGTIGRISYPSLSASSGFNLVAIARPT